MHSKLLSTKTSVPTGHDIVDLVAYLKHVRTYYKDGIASRASEIVAHIEQLTAWIDLLENSGKVDIPRSRLARVHLLIGQGLEASTVGGKHEALERLGHNIGPWICASCSTSFPMRPEKCPVNGCNELLDKGF